MEQQKVYEIEKGLGFVWEVRPDGRQSLADIVQQGMAAECPDSPNTMYELRVQASAVIRIHPWAHLSRQPEQMLRLLIQVRAHTMRSLQLAMIGRQKYIRERLDLLLAFLDRQFGVRFKDEQRLVPFVLTHEEMASAVNSTRSTVTRIMNELEREGRISHVQMGKKRLIVLSAAHAAEAAEPGAACDLASPLH